MIIEEIIAGIDEGGPRSYYAFETFIQHLFKHHIESQGKKLIISAEPTRFGDAFAPDGFDQFDGPTVIEIKFNLAKLPMSLFLNKLVNQFKNEYIENKFAYLLVISAKPIPEKWLYRFDEELGRIQLPFKVYFWGPEELNKVASKYRKIVNRIANNLFALRLSSAISKPVRDWKQEREEIIDNLKACYNKGQFSLFLGAGVSSSAGMPDWNTLLNSLCNLPNSRV